MNAEPASTGGSLTVMENVPVSLPLSAVAVGEAQRARLDALYKALEKIRPGQGLAYNVGIGKGYSVREVVRVAEEVTGCLRSVVSISPSQLQDAGPHNSFGVPSLRRGKCSSRAR